ncbi:MAG: VOC family protein [Gemmatimonadetes bacterium]|nr:VOC family protein [Gemmatimonadota bacterium]
MTLALTGMHHVSALSAHIGRSRDFYTRILGLRPLIKTVNQDAPSMYHLFFGDGAGTPGSDLTVFDIPRAAREKPGNNSISLTTFRIAGESSLAFWESRLDEHGVARGQITSRDGRAVLDFADAEGTQLSLVDDGGAGESFPWGDSPVSAEHQVRGLGYTVITVPTREPTERFRTGGLGLVHDRSYALPEDERYQTHVYRAGAGGPHAEVHVIVREDLPQARYGAGGVHHFALRVPEMDAVQQWADRLDDLGYVNSGVVERYYFRSVYVREPNGVFFELATDGPGFEVDGPLDGDHLKLPPFLEPRRAEIETRLKPLTADR